ncbi:MULTISPECIES: hypothetical protein [Streptomyces]|uniref:hypothetical protein n=1 Tax=Streptomyces TaxID=1883 RepID=UPI000F7AE92F|nr:hypothetical protein [Streptomyces sp. WAC05858]RSS39453.1 hypothetical protein EF902_27590 [Streptomyces sp. WAC05858]WTA79282.1 hypothetical protein OG751_04415 [Streptomyces antimycoticus]
MTIHLPRLGATGKHRAIDRARQLEAENAELACRTVALARENDTLQGQLDQAGITISGLLLDREKSVTTIRRLQQQRINDAIEKARLRRELANTRPRITAAATHGGDASHVQLPYPVPVQATQEAA